MSRPDRPGETERPGFFIPYRYRADVDDRRGNAAATRLFAEHEAGFAGALALIDAYAEALARIPADPSEHGAPRWRQDWFPALDAAIAYALVRNREPTRIVEVGAGHSTRFLARAVADGGLATELTAIDPAPRAGLAGLPVAWIAAVVQQAGDAPFRALQPGDMVSIDSSHILMPGTDVDLLLGDVLPALPAGVLVHIHDIMLPDPYPADWAWRGYNEQQAVAAMLGAGGWRPLFASRYVATRMPDALAASVAGRLPGNPQASAGSLWLEKTGRAI
ncbi:MAG: class I SAM-dependent methyltransferase [Alphaproteobacteria bacterium]